MTAVIQFGPRVEHVLDPVLDRGLNPALTWRLPSPLRRQVRSLRALAGDRYSARAVTAVRGVVTGR